ncbi:MAG: hypothetical protein ACLGIF_08615 [Actinomycetes bacterium]
MGRRLFWFGVGAGATVLVVIKVRSYLRHASPEALGQRAKESAHSVTDSVREFTATVRAAMAEREAELRAALNGREESSDGLGRPE